MYFRAAIPVHWFESHFHHSFFVLVHNAHSFRCWRMSDFFYSPIWDRTSLFSASETHKGAEFRVLLSISGKEFFHLSSYPFLLDWFVKRLHMFQTKFFNKRNVLLFHFIPSAFKDVIIHFRHYVSKFTGLLFKTQYNHSVSQCPRLCLSKIIVHVETKDISNICNFL